MSDIAVSDANEQQGDMPLRVSPLFVALMAFASFSMWMGLIPLTESVIPTHVRLLVQDSKGIASLLQSFGGLSAMLVYPLVGALSDRTFTRFGHRRPWLVAGAIGSALMLVGLANAHNVWLLSCFWVTFCVFANMTQSSIMTLLPEKIPVTQRAKVAALIGLMAPVGIVVGLKIAGALTENKAFFTTYYVIAAVGIVAVLLFATQLHEASSPETLPSFKLWQFVKGFWIDPREHPDFALAWWARILFILGYATVQNYLIHFITDTGLFPADKASNAVANFQATSTIALLVGSFATGFISDRLQRRKPFAIVAGSFVTVGLLILAFVRVWGILQIGAAFLGLGFGIYASTEVALGTQVLPSKKSHGRDMGVLSLAGNIPQTLAPLYALAIISQTGNYALLFSIAAIPPLLSALFITRIKSVR